MIVSRAFRKVKNALSDSVIQNTSHQEDSFLICGLGSLGQHCVLSLKKFGVKIVAIELLRPQFWEIPHIEDVIDKLIFADCRYIKTLQQADIQKCRAALLVTTSEQVNIETALAIRQLNPKTHLVVRSAQDNLNSLLEEQLGNFIAYEPTQLPTTAFALAALGSNIKGFFTLDSQPLQIIQRRLKSNDPWCYTRYLHELDTRTRSVLSYHHQAPNFWGSFYQWNPETIIQPGDLITYVQVQDVLSSNTLKFTNTSIFFQSKPFLLRIKSFIF